MMQDAADILKDVSTKSGSAAQEHSAKHAATIIRRGMFGVDSKEEAVKLQ